MTDVLLFGDRGLLLRVAERSQVLDWYAELDANPVPGQQDLVPADGTLLVRVAHPRQRTAALTDLRRRPSPAATGRDSGPEVSLRVAYDGPDLAQVADVLGMSTDAVVARHTGQVWTVAFTGFAPGFGYLIGDAGGLDVPRLDSPRTRVPSGSVALAAGYSAVYPRESPGGWQLIGRSDAVLWDLERDPPSLLVPGARVRFKAGREVAEVAAPRPSAPRVSGAGLRAERPGPLTIPVDEGRPGYAHLGVPGSGATDRSAYRAANALVGNPQGAAALEITLGGLVVTAVGDQRLALAGATVALSARGPGGTRDVPWATGFLLRDGERLTVGNARTGLRCYLAVAGGVDLAPVLGSQSSDVLSGLGPAPMSRGDLIPVAAPPRVTASAGDVAVDAVNSADGRPHRDRRHGGRIAGTDARLEVTAGPATEQIPGALDQLVAESWTVTPQSNRIGLRLGGSAMRWTARIELSSAPLVPGAIQLPPSGEPVVFLRDHPTTGGYPVVGVLTEGAIDVAAQLRPGERLTFVIAPASAQGSSPADR